MSHISRPITNSESYISRTSMMSYAAQKVAEDAELRALREMELRAAQDSKRLWEREERLRRQDELDAMGMMGRKKDKDDLHSWMTSEIERKRALSERVKRKEQRDQRRKLKRILRDPAKVVAYPPINEEPPKNKETRLKSEKHDMNTSLRYQMDSKRHHSSRMKQLERQLDQENLSYLKDQEHKFSMMAHQRREELKAEYRDRWRSEIEAKNLKNKIEHDEKKFQEVMYQQSRKQYYDVITGLPMQERAFTPCTTYGDTYRKAGVERKIRAPQPPVIEEETRENGGICTDYSSKFDILSNKSEAKIEEEEDEAAKEGEDEIIELEKGKYEGEGPLLPQEKKHQIKSKARIHHGKSKSHGLTNEQKKKLLKEKYEQYEQKLRNMDRRADGWRSISHSPNADDLSTPTSSQRLKFALVSPGRLGKKREQILFRAGVTNPERSRPMADDLFENRFMNSVERDALKRNIEQAQKKAYEDKRKAWEQQVINYKIDLIDGYRQTDLMQRQLHYYEYLKSEAEKKKRKEKEDKFKDFMSAHIKGNQGYPRGPHPAPELEYAMERNHKKEQLCYIVDQMKQNERKRKKEDKREKKQDKALIRTDLQAKSMLDQLVSIKHSTLKQDLLESWHKGKQLLDAKRNFQKLGNMPRLAQKHGSFDNQDSKSILTPESIIPSQHASDMAVVKKIRSPQASTVKHLLQTTSGYMSAEKEKQEGRVNRRGNPSLLHWNDKPVEK